MPLYEFRCQCCGERFERLVRAGNQDEIVCPRCQAGAVERLFSTFAARGGAGCAPSASDGIGGG